MTLILYVASYVLCFAAGEYWSKEWSLAPCWPTGCLAVGSYGLGTVVWLYALRAHGNLTVLTTLLTCLCLVAGVGVGLGVFHEPVTVRQLLGIALALAAAFMLS